MNDLEKELKGKVEFEKINVDENQDKAAKHQVLSIPTYIIEKDGQELERIVGATQKENFPKILSKGIKSIVKTFLIAKFFLTL